MNNITIIIVVLTEKKNKTEFIIITKSKRPTKIDISFRFGKTITYFNYDN